MNLEAEISLFFGRTPSVIRTISTERLAVACLPKLADRERKAVNDKITADWYGKGVDSF